MDHQQRLDELLNRWDELADAGEELTPEEHCQHDPELLEAFKQALARLQAIDRLLTGEPQEEEAQLLAAGRYQPVELHAQGGIGDVFKAEDAELGRVVALKRIRRNDSHHPVRSKRFEAEAKITGHLEHPGIVPVYGFERDAKGRLFYAMRMIHGGTLQDAIERFHKKYPVGSISGEGTLAMQNLLRSFLKVCETVAYAHSKGVIHRDLKPANIMVGEYGETLVVDWGLAKDTQRKDVAEETVSAATPAALRGLKISDRTLLGEIKGSPAYMSPEQASGDNSQVGVGSDVYSLGATLFAILTNRKPFDGRNVYQVLESVKSGRVPSPRSIRPDISRPLEAICLKAMSRNPRDRYATPNDLASDIELWLADEPITTWREPWTKRAARWAKRHRTLVASLGMAALVALGALVVTNAILKTKNQELTVANTRATENFEQAHAALLGVVDLALHGRTMGGNRYLDPVRHDVLQRAIQFAEKLRPREPANQDLILEHALLLTTRGEIELRLGEADQANKSLQQAVTLFGPPMPGESLDFQHGRAVANYELAEVLRWQDTEKPRKSDDLIVAAGTELEKLVRGHLASEKVLNFSRLYDPALLLSRCVQSLRDTAPQRTAWLTLADQSLGDTATPDLAYNIQRESSRARMWAIEARLAARAEEMPRLLSASKKSLAAYKRAIELGKEYKKDEEAGMLYRWEMAEVEITRDLAVALSDNPAVALPKLIAACEARSRLMGKIELEGDKLVAMWGASDPLTSRGLANTTVNYLRLQLVDNLLSVGGIAWDSGNEALAKGLYADAEKLLAKVPAAGLEPWARNLRAKSQIRLAGFLLKQPARSRLEVRHLLEEADKTLVELQGSASEDPEFTYYLSIVHMSLGELAVQDSQHKAASEWFAKIVPLRKELTRPDAPLQERIIAAKCAAQLAKAWLDSEGATMETIWKESHTALSLLDDIRSKLPQMGIGEKELTRMATDVFAAAALLWSRELLKQKPIPVGKLREVCEPARNALQKLPQIAGPLTNLESQILEGLEKALKDH